MTATNILMTQLTLEFFWACCESCETNYTTPQHIDDQCAAYMMGGEL